MDPELDIAGAFVLQEMKSEPWREVTGEHLGFPRKQQLQQICLFEMGKTEENWIPFCRKSMTWTTFLKPILDQSGKN